VSTARGPGGCGKDSIVYPFKLVLVSQTCHSPDGIAVPGLEIINMMDASLQQICNLALSWCRDLRPTLHSRRRI